MESAVLRAKKLVEKGGLAGARAADIASVFCSDAIQRVEMTARNTIAALAEGDDARILLTALKRFTKNSTPINTVEARRRIAKVLIDANTYAF